MRKRTTGLIVGAVLTVGCAVAAYATPPGVNGPIAFRRVPDESSPFGATLFVVNPDGTGELQLTHPPVGTNDEGPPSFAPDGSNLVFTRDESKTQSIWRVNTDGSGEQRLTPPPRFEHPVGPQANQRFNVPAYSPNGQLIAFVRGDPPFRRLPGGGRALKQSLDVMAPEGTNTRRVVELGYGLDADVLAWSPNGNRIAYTAVRLRRKMAFALFVVGARGGRPHRITSWRKGGIDVDWSPGGKLLLVRLAPPGSEFEGGNYYTMRPDGSGLRRLTHFAPKATTGFARWSPDGTRIVFANGGVDGRDDVFVMRADGSGITPVTRTPTWDSAPAWGPAH
jgi:TolB protein